MTQQSDSMHTGLAMRKPATAHELGADCMANGAACIWSVISNTTFYTACIAKDLAGVCLQTSEWV